MYSIKPFLILLIAIFICSCRTTTPTKKESAKQDKRHYISYQEKDGRALLKTRAVKFQHSENGQTVELIGMVHLAQQSFYNNVQELCDSSDIVLTEGVRGRGNFSPYFFSLYYMLSSTGRLADTTGLVEQHEGMTPQENWRNADITLQQLSQQRSWGESFMTVAATPIAFVGIETYFLSTWLENIFTFPFEDFQAERHESRRKMLFSESVEAAEVSEVFSHSIIHSRNEYLLNCLDKVENNKSSIAIPWGAAHGPGIEKGLIERGYEIQSEKWLTVTGNSDERLGADGWQFKIPWIIRIGQTSEDIFYLHLLADFLVWYKGESSVVSLGWQQIFYNAPHHGESSIFPQILHRPLIWDKRRENGTNKYRWLLFFEN